MVGPTQIVMAPSKRIAPNPPLTMRRLGRLALWASGAAAALLVAVMAGRSDVGSQRMAVVLSSLSLGSLRSLHLGPLTTQVAAQIQGQAVRPRLDEDSNAGQLAQTVRGLAEDRDQIMTRLAAVERNLDDVTGSATRQSEVFKSEVFKAALQPSPSSEPAGPATPATQGAVVTAMPPPALSATPLSPSVVAAATDAVPSPSATEYAIDLGGSSFMQALHARWAEIHAAHPQLFEGLRPAVTLKETERSKHVELRLVVGPLASADAASHLCASLGSFRMLCHPTTLDGPHLALR